MKRQSGFNLVEIMIAIGLIGIIAAFVIPNINAGSAQSRDAERKATLRTVQGALELYKNKYGRYPAGCNPNPVSSSTLAHWEGIWSGEPGSDWLCSDGSANYIRGLAPEFIPTLPRDPFRDGRTDRSYVYTTNPAGTVYKFMSINGAEDEVVTYDSPFARCGDINLGTGENGNMCAAIPGTAIGGYAGYNQDITGNLSNQQCLTTHPSFSSTYAVSGGFAPGGQRNAAYLETEKAREWFTDMIRCN
jgi:prepilin-type N-terminal cleavage/methylation domain-containing protein